MNPYQSYPQKSVLNINFENGENNLAFIKSRHFTPTLKIFSPFYEDGYANLMLLNVSAGIMANDSQEFNINIGDKCKVELTSQSYEKIHKMPQNLSAHRIQRFVIGHHSAFIYSPMPCIPFSESSFYSNTRLDITNSSNICYSEILSAGRIHYTKEYPEGERFKYRNFCQELQIYKDNKLAIQDKLFLKPDSINPPSMCAFYKNTHYLSMIIISEHINDNTRENLNQILTNSNLLYGISELPILNGYSIKVLSASSEALMTLRNLIVNQIKRTNFYSSI